MGAYKNSHRPGTTPQQWAFARVNSFMSGGKTQKTTDSDLWAKVKKESVEEGKTAFKKDKKYVIEKESSVEIVRRRHRKEREASKKEFDSELDAARLRDTRITNNKNEEFEALIAERQDINQD